MTLGRRQAGAETIQLVMQPLAQHLQLADELAAMADDAEQRFHRRLLRATTKPLTGKPHECSAITIVRLEPARAKLCPRRLRLRRYKQTDTSGKPPLELRRPSPMKRASRLNRDQRLPRALARSDQPRELVDASPQRRQRHRLSDQSPLTACQQDPVCNLAGIDRHNQRLRRQRLLKQTRHEQPPLEKKEGTKRRPPDESADQTSSVPISE